jgi:hypothetical protein
VLEYLPKEKLFFSSMAFYLRPMAVHVYSWNQFHSFSYCSDTASSLDGF